MKYLSVCSGIEAATVAWHPLGWEPLAFSEIEPFPRLVLQHHYPDVPLHGDFTVLRDQPWIVDADVLVGGTPCQAFSVAGQRQSLADDRGNLTLEFVRLADAIDDLRRAGGREPAIIVWENVPGVLSVKDNAFGCFLGAIVGNDTALLPTGGKWTNAGMVIGPKRAAAWRVLDAQYFGVAQRRRRVFVVASARDGLDPAEVLFERDRMRRDTPPRRETGKAAPTIPSRSTEGGGLGTDFDCDGGLIASTLKANNGGGGFGSDPSETFVPVMAHTVGAPTARGVNDYGAPAVDEGHYFPVAFHPTQDPISSEDGTTHALGCGSSNGQASIAVAVSFDPGQSANPKATHQYCEEHTPPLIKERVHAVAFDITGTGPGTITGAKETDVHTALRSRTPGSSENSTTTVINHSMAVRRLTPRECERLQGFPDDYTLIPVRGKDAADGPRYKALGNSMAVPVMAWIGGRIQKRL